MTIAEVITNLKNYDGWGYKNYSLNKDEADAIIDIFNGLKLEDEIRITNCKLDSIAEALNAVKSDLLKLSEKGE